MLARELAKPRRPYPMNWLSRLLDPHAVPAETVKTAMARAYYWYDKWLEREGEIK
jgi:hypothetical protein